MVEPSAVGNSTSATLMSGSAGDTVTGFGPGWAKSGAAWAAAISASDRPTGLNSPTGADPQQILETLFGYQTFRPGQREIIDAVLAGRDCIGVMPTGAGKSLTFQIPAKLLNGTVLVLSPLISLMKDQVDALDRAGF